MKSGIFKVLFSNQLTTVLLLLFAIAMAYGTFLENDFGTQAVQTLIYKSWWFELIMFLLVLNFAGNIFKYKLLRKEKFPIFLFHVAFIVTLMGAFVTRYFGFEGLMHIREGAASSEIVSQDRYLQIEVSKGDYKEALDQKLNLSFFNQPDFDLSLGQKDELSIKAAAFVPQAEQKVVQSENGGTVLTIVTAGTTGRENLYLQSGGSILVNNYPVTFNNPVTGAVNIYEIEGELKIQSPVDLTFMIMATQSGGSLKADTLQDLNLRALYRGEGVAFVVPEVFANSAVVYRQSEDQKNAKQLDDLLFVKISDGQMTHEVLLPAFDGNYSDTQHIQMADYHVDISYGPKPIKLPFEIALKDFELIRYPGSVSPSSYSSRVTVIDGETAFPYHIYMNNVLDYRGYRFFQASYDNDELGTVLSVNSDWWGTNITYIGYTLLGIGMFLTLFWKNSRFQIINKKLSDLNVRKVTAFLLLIMGMWSSASAQEKKDVQPFLESLKSGYIPADKANDFGKLLVQDLDGRIKPVNTLSSEFLRKVHGRSSFALTPDMKLNSDQQFLMMQINPLIWQAVPIIKIDPKKGGEILKTIGKDETKYLAFSDLLDEQGNYLLLDLVEEANRKKPSERSNLDKELINVDERFNVFFQGLTGYYLKLFPLEGDPENTWFHDKYEGEAFKGEDSVFVKRILPMYYQSVLKASRDKDWTMADETLSYIHTFQNIKGTAVIPSENIQKAELLYNKLRLFNHLFSFFWLVGLVLLVVAIFAVFYPESVGVKRTNQVFTGLIFLGFLALTFNLILRWYAAQYPPWSNGYEMIILVSWALMLFGFGFYKKSDFVVPLAALFAGTLLFVAFLDWLNPEITNLVPVLKSYWLKIHVAIIVSSYAPLALSALLGILTLAFMIVEKKGNDRLYNSMKELSYISEMSMTIGLFMLTIGTFLGGVWANESWGRYWGWDPKETWALISVIVYATVLHLRLVPKLNDLYVYSLSSVVAFFSIIMTSFGVNYYLAGLHSYAKGDPVPIPQFVYWIVASVVLLALLSRWNYQKLHGKKR
ncbi:cytochrome c biogenesis protein CcsA [Reichenbachiella agarivorans]|uniref:Cytochrome c biogenesis protein CcsA n=1 Tax=Reichenbachiella agarivorans TaxID=2979464 RepID=A0ABY6CJX6_9BACT|nr:cytochrome c biogenesis protein CcsA [Reichenbachiella agarivorans]UXP30813.1 cytochrome c biogenesis protein CcsA [Reichenbachiella agarivorans]